MNGGHGRDDCKDAKVCNQCDKAHHTIWHFIPHSKERENIRESNVRQYKLSKPSAASKANDCNEVSLNKVSNVPYESVHLKIIPLIVVGSTSTKPIYALLNEGATVLIINKKIVNQIGAVATFVNIALRVVGQEQPIITI